MAVPTLPLPYAFSPITYQCSRRQCRNAESPSIRTKMATVSVAHTANTIHRTIPPTQPSNISPLRKTMFHNTSDNSATKGTHYNADYNLASCLSDQHPTFTFGRTHIQLLAWRPAITNEFHWLHVTPDKCWNSIYTLKQARNLAQNKSVTRVCNQDMTACFTSVSVANPLSSVYFFRGTKQYKSMNIIRTSLLWVNQPSQLKCRNQSQIRLAVWGPVISTSLAVPVFYKR